MVLAVGLTVLEGIVLYKFGDNLLENDCTEIFWSRSY